MKIGEYLLQRLQEYGVNHVFGIPGDYVLNFYKMLEDSPIGLVNTCDEQGAGYAADAYARVKGMGCVCITYCVGGFKVINTTAQAHAEKSPVVVISGAPGMGERIKNPLLHHKVRDFDTQQKVFNEVTVCSVLLDDPNTALTEIDRALDACFSQKRPVYIELPRDCVHVEAVDSRFKRLEEDCDPGVMKACLEDAIERLNSAKNPIILADVEIHRFGLQNKLMELIERTGIPVATTILGKSVIREDHPLYLGVYEGAMGQPKVRKIVEDSDALLMLGVFMTDINLGIYTAQLEPSRSIYSTSEKTTVGYRGYEDVTLLGFLDGLLASSQLSPRPHLSVAAPLVPKVEFKIKERDLVSKITIERLYLHLNEFLNASTTVIVDVGDAMFAGIDLSIHCRTQFLASAYYASMGFSVPAAIGVQVALPDQRPIVLVGDGAFQMTGMELSCCVRYGLNPIVIVLDNQGYGTERPMLDGSFNDVQGWNHEHLPLVLGSGKSAVVRTEGEFVSALKQALEDQSCLQILHVHIDPNDHSLAQLRLGRCLSERIQKE